MNSNGLKSRTYLNKDVLDAISSLTLEVRRVVEGLQGGGHRSMAKGIIPLKAFRKVYRTADRERIRSALFDAFVRAIHQEKD